MSDRDEYCTFRHLHMQYSTAGVWEKSESSHSSLEADSKVRFMTQTQSHKLLKANPTKTC